MQSGLETNIHIMGGHGSGWEESAESWNAPAALERLNEKLSSFKSRRHPSKDKPIHCKKINHLPTKNGYNRFIAQPSLYRWIQSFQ